MRIKEERCSQTVEGVWELRKTLRSVVFVDEFLFSFEDRLQLGLTTLISGRDHVCLVGLPNATWGGEGRKARLVRCIRRLTARGGVRRARASCL